MQRKILSFTLTLIISITLFAQGELYPKQTINGQEYYMYTVEKGDGFWGVSKKFGVTQAELHQYNPFIAEGLQLGQTLQIPVRQAVYKPQLVALSTPTTPSTSIKQHTVEKGQTVYAISRMYGVSIDEIIAVNPEVADDLRTGRISVGEVLNIPTKKASSDKSTSTTGDTIAYVTHEVKKKETLYSISRQYGIEINDILEHNEIGTELKKGQILKIYGSSRNKEQVPQSKKEESVTIIKDTIVTPVVENTQPVATEEPHAMPTSLQHSLQVAVLMPFKLDAARADRNTEKFVDFYRGVLLAANSLKLVGLSTDIYAYDTSNTEVVIDSLLQLPEMKNMDLIIGPAYSNQIDKVTAFAKQNRIYVAVPFSQNVSDIEVNPYVFQFNPSVTILHKIAITKMLEQRPANKYMIAYVENCTDNGNKFAEAFQTELIYKNINYSTHVVNVASMDSIAKLAISENSVLLLASSNADRVRPLLKILRSQITPISLIGFDDWGKSLLNSTKPVCYYSLFSAEVNNESYEKVYTKSFGGASESYPRYDKIGYDVTNNLLQILMLSSDKKNVTMIPTVPGVQSTIEFVRITPKGGWVNQHVYINQLQ